MRNCRPSTPRCRAKLDDSGGLAQKRHEETFSTAPISLYCFSTKGFERPGAITERASKIINFARKAMSARPAQRHHHHSALSDAAPKTLKGPCARSFSCEKEIREPWGQMVSRCESCPIADLTMSSTANRDHLCRHYRSQRAGVRICAGHRSRDR